MHFHTTRLGDASRIIMSGAVVLLPFTSAFGQAGGLAFPEQGGPISGTAQAGQAAVARDASTAWLNPAGLTRIEGTQFLTAIQPFVITLEFDTSSSNTATGSDGGDAGGFVLGGSMYLAHQVNDRVGIGFSITAPFGLGIDYRDNWVGRHIVTETELLTLNFQPSVGFEVVEGFSIGAGLDIQYARFEQEIAVNQVIPTLPARVDIDGDNWEVGFTLGLLFEPQEGTRLGLRYRSELDHDLDGDLKALAKNDVSTNLTLPQSLTFSFYQDVNDQVAILFDFGWTDWNAFDRTTIEIDGSTGNQIEIPRHFDSTLNVGLGFHYRPHEKWLLMGGVSYVTSAVDDEDRTPDLPVDKQFRIAVGLEHELSPRSRIGINYTYISFGDNEISTSAGPTPLAGTIAGQYDPAGAHVVGIYASFAF